MTEVDAADPAAAGAALAAARSPAAADSAVGDSAVAALEDAADQAADAARVAAARVAVLAPGPVLIRSATGAAIPARNTTAMHPSGWTIRFGMPEAIPLTVRTRPRQPMPEPTPA